MKKILIANDLLKGGGVENVLKNIVQYLSEQGNDVITLMIPGSSSSEIQNVFGKTIKMQPPMRKLKSVKKYSFWWFLDRGLYVIQKQIYRIIIFLKQYDVIIALKEGPIMKEISGLYAKKKYAWIHVDYNYLHWTEHCFKSSEDERKCMMKYDEVVCVSKSTAKSVVDQIGNPGNLVVRLNPINVSEIIEKSSQQVKELERFVDSRKINRPILVSVGRLCEQKGYVRLLNTCAKLNLKFDYELWIIGDGPDRIKLEEIIIEKKLSNVVLWGNQNNPYPFIKQANLFVSSAIWESYGLALQEALILGVPVIATTCPAFEECVSMEEVMLVDNSETALYNGLYKILDDDNILYKYVQTIRNNKMRNQENLFDIRLRDIKDLWKD